MWTAFLDLDIHLSFFFFWPLLGPSRSVQWQFNSGVGGGRREELSIPLFRWLSVTGWGDRGEGIGSDPRLNVTHFRSAHIFYLNILFKPIRFTWGIVSYV